MGVGGGGGGGGGGKVNKTVFMRKPQHILKRKRKESRAESNRGPSAYQPNDLTTRPNRLTYMGAVLTPDTKERREEEEEKKKKKAERKWRQHGA